MTIKDLARESGYSLGTVSRVLNGHPNVSEKARRAVLAIVEARGFELNANAKLLKQTRSDNILVIVKGRENEMFSDMVERLQALFSETPYSLVIDYIDELGNEVHRAATLCREKKPRGVMFLGGTQGNFREEFSKIQVPAVLLTGDASELHYPNLTSVTTDDFRGGYCAAEYLIRTGHREILVLGGQRTLSDTSQLRYAGCIAAFEKYALEFDERRYYTCRYSYRDGYDAMRRAMQDGMSCTAVFAMADVIAVGAIRALREHGLRVPEDVSVVGYDGLSLGDYLMPRLTTVAQSTREIAARGARALLSAIETDAPMVGQITVPFSFARKESVRALI